MTKTEIQSASTLKLLMLVFGKQPADQSLSDFAKECGTLKDDSGFVEEVRQYALANLVTGE